jgi:5-methyltetrahydropteroyltriglutamate--homocysteine methyltransferase
MPQAFRTGSKFTPRPESERREGRSIKMAKATNLGFPRIGGQRELKCALEGYWSGDRSQQDLLSATAELRQHNWQLQSRAGLDHIPSNDFSLYDHVLDTTAMVGAVPERYGWQGGQVELDTYFAMARGRPSDDPAGGVAPMEMTKWFDTNYHYLVPEFWPGQIFSLGSTKPVDEFVEARRQGLHTRPVLLGPVSFLLLGKTREEGFDQLELLEELLRVYEQVLQKLNEAGADWVQIDEPFLGLDLTDAQRNAFAGAYDRLAKAAPQLNLLVATYFAELRDNANTALNLPVAGLHLDLARGGELETLLSRVPEGLSLSLGLIDGRNIWKRDLSEAIDRAERAVAALGKDRVMIGPSCSLLHVPVDLDRETKLDDELKSWLAFARQKLREIAIVAEAINGGRDSVAPELQENAEAMESRRNSPRIHDRGVKQRVANVDHAMTRRQSAFPERKRAQQQRLNLPPLPTTTIGSFPQTKEVRQQRARYRRGEISDDQYTGFLEAQTEKCVRFQEEADVDVLVHGEFERNDMVEFFGEHLEGFTPTIAGWVQSYGSRCVKPPIIYGDLQRQGPITVGWSTFAQALTDRPVKGMLTAPVTSLQWSFVRDDQPRKETCQQIALAIRDEVQDLEEAGISAIQIDEPALREGLPLRRADWDDYLDWAVTCFRLASSGVADQTQIHTHMCYAEFNDIIHAIADLDADVISVEASRSDMELLQAFKDYQYPNDIGPGVWDIHSPRIPSAEHMANLVQKAAEVLAPEQLWVNPDCGLKTRKGEEVEPALKNMVAAARQSRKALGLTERARSE